MESVPPVRILHLKVQDGQPPGSESRKCSLCGVMLWGADSPRWTDDKERFEKGELPEGYIKCNGKLPWERDLKTELGETSPAPEPSTSIRERPGLAKAEPREWLRTMPDSPHALHGRADSDEKKTLLLARLLDVWKKHPHMRLGQLLVNSAPGNHPNPALFYCEDEDLLLYLEDKKEITPDMKERLYTEAEATEMSYLLAFTHLMGATANTNAETAKKLEELAEMMKKKTE